MPVLLAATLGLHSAAQSRATFAFPPQIVAKS
jgi:hypothetical protein